MPPKGASAHLAVPALMPALLTLAARLRTSAPPDISLSTEERRAFDRLFENADKEQLGVLTGDKAVPFFEASELPGQVGAASDHLVMCHERGRNLVDAANRLY